MYIYIYIYIYHVKWTSFITVGCGKISKRIISMTQGLGHARTQNRDLSDNLSNRRFQNTNRLVHVRT